MSKSQIIIANSVLLDNFEQFTVGQGERVRIVFELNSDAAIVPTATAANLAVERCTDNYAPFSTFEAYGSANGIEVTTIDITEPGVYRVVYTPWVLDNDPVYEDGLTVVASANISRARATKGLPTVLPVPGELGDVLTRVGTEKDDVKYLPPAAAEGGGGGEDAFVSSEEAFDLYDTNGSLGVFGGFGPGYFDPAGAAVVNSASFVEVVPSQPNGVDASMGEGTAPVVHVYAVANLTASLTGNMGLLVNITGWVAPGHHATLVGAWAENFTDGAFIPCIVAGSQEMRFSVVNTKVYNVRMLFAVQRIQPLDLA